MPVVHLNCFRALLLDFNEDPKRDKKSKKKVTNFFDEDRSDNEDSNQGVINDDDDDDDDSDIDMEITWQPGLKGKTEQKSTTSKESVNEKKKNNDKNKKREKSNRRSQPEQDDDDEEEQQQEMNSTENDRATLELLAIDDDADGKRDFNLRDMIKSHKQATKAAAKNAKKSRKAQQSSSNAVEENNNDAFQLNVNDKRFQAVFNQPAFNIDQSDPHFKPTFGTQRLIDEKLKKRKLDHLNSSSRTDRDEDDIVVKLKRKSAKKDE